MAVLFSPWGNQQFFDESGNPATGWKIYSYVAGSSTALATYTTSAGSVSQTNPIVLDALGFATGGQVWLTSGLSYKLVLTDANGAVKKTEDNVTGVASSSSADQWVTSGLTPTYISATSFTLAGDQTSAFHIGRRIKATVTAGTVYGTITASAFSALTTVTLEMDSGNALDSGLTAVSYSLLSKTNDALPRGIFPTIANVAGHLFGLTLSNNVADATNDIDIAVGVATDSTNAYMLTLASAFTKRLDAAWAAGSGNGGLDTGAIANALYNVFVIRKDSDGSTDALFSLSATAPTMPAGYTAKRRIGSILRVGATIRPFIQKGDRFYFKTPTLDYDNNALGTVAATPTLNVPPNTIALLNVYLERSGAAASVYINPTAATAMATSDTVAPLTTIETGANGAAVVLSSSQVEVLVDASSQIRVVASAASTTLRLAPIGYIDNRGKDA